MAKSNNKTVATTASVSKYISAISDLERRKDCMALKDLMKTVTGNKPVMWGESLVGFGAFTVTSKAGREVEWVKMGFSSRKQAISIYLTCNLDEFKRELRTLGTFKRGVGCLYIKSLSDVDMKILESMCRSSLKRLPV